MLPGIIEVFWYILPAYVANSAAIDVSGLPVLKHYSAPVDLGKTYRGKRIFGPGKTWRGLIVGVLSATLCGWLMQTYDVAAYLPMTPLLGFMLGLGAMLGDLAGSFAKRQFGLKRGHPVFLLDQLDYIVGAYLFTQFAAPLGLGYFITASLITLPLHFAANIVAWIIHLKKKPW